jgi:hypothetical protein
MLRAFLTSPLASRKMKPAQVRILSLVALVTFACAQPAAPDEASQSKTIVPERAAFVQANPDAAANERHEGCTFSRGTTTCVSTIQFEQTTTRREISGCIFGPFSPPIAGRRTRTFEDTDLVTVRRVTYYRGRSNHAYASEDQELSRVHERSRMISDTCEAL